MNFLKSVTSSVLSSTGVSFPFTIGERIPGIEAGATIWDIREGVKKDDGSPITLFIFDSTLPPLQPGNKDRRSLLQLASNALKKLRTIRHPDVIKYVDSVETETHIYIATEPVRPLGAVLRDWGTSGAISGSAAKKKEEKEAWLGWGVKNIATALAFLNSPPLSQHHAYLTPASVFITPAMEWRLGGFELLTGRDNASGVLWGMGGVAPGGVAEYSSPEVKKNGWAVLKETDPALEDSYLLAMFLFTLYNPERPIPTLSSAPTPASAGALPRRLFPLWKRMLSPNARARLSTINFVTEAGISGIWSDNPLVTLVDGLDGFELRSDGEKQSLLRIIKDSADHLPEPFLVHRVLPSLLHSVTLPNAPAATMLPLILTLGNQVPPSMYSKVVLDPVVKLYASPDRGTRMALLDGLEQYADKLDSRTVSERIWPHLITGFADTVPIIREATIKAIYPLASKLTDRLLNNDLLRLLAKMQTDPEPSIRTNTCILLGRLAPKLGYNTKKKVLVPAFARSLKDSFVHARVAALMALMASVEIFDRDEVAARVIPNMSFALVDKEKVVRDQAFKAMAMFVKRLEEDVASMPDTVLTEEQRNGVQGVANGVGGSGGAAPAQGRGLATAAATTAGAAGAGLVTSAAGAAGSLAGWAFSSLSKQMASGEANSALTAANASPAEVVPSRMPTLSTPDTSRRPSSDVVPPAARVASFGASTSGAGKSMKLGGNKPTPASLASSLLDDLDDDEVANAWGTDLIDVNADTDDWSAFETAPIEEAVVPPPQDYYVSAPKPKPAPAARVTRPAHSRPAPARTPSASSSTPSSPPPVHAPRPIRAAPTRAAPSMSRSSSEISKSSTPGPGKAATPVQLSALSKEEKEKEMARRREERKARIAAMKAKK